ncbi:hypothetical protein [Nocardia sp. NPDC050175]|uniref:hypothetical protein n=1 Tax=Nocardia sp. NPDC050175 TaxID=3364317 RepID=UPI0037AE64DA
MSGDGTSGFFRRAAEGREVSGFFGRGGKGQPGEGQGVPGDGFGQDAEGQDAASRGAQSDRVGGPAGWSAEDFGDRAAGGWGRSADRPDDSTADAASRSTGAADTSGDRAEHGTAGGRPKDAAGEGDPADGMAEFVAELKLLAESVLERVEPVLRQAADGQVEWSSCSWCPVCAAAALMRGQHHEVLQTVADHGTAIVTVLREALAGVPVDPVMPESDPTGGPQHNHAVPQDYSPDTSTHAEPGAGQHASRATKRSRYVSIPVTIKA